MVTDCNEQALKNANGLQGSQDRGVARGEEAGSAARH
jgi:hypothetical protein